MGALPDTAQRQFDKFLVSTRGGRKSLVQQEWHILFKLMLMLNICDGIRRKLPITLIGDDKQLYYSYMWSAVAQQSTETGFVSLLLPFRSLGIFVLSTMPQFTQLYKWVPGDRHWCTDMLVVICEWIIFARNCCMARTLTREVELVSEWTGLPGGKVQCALNGPTDWIHALYKKHTSYKDIPLLFYCLNILTFRMYAC